MVGRIHELGTTSAVSYKLNNIPKITVTIWESEGVWAT
jgi:hypothetical protein